MKKKKRNPIILITVSGTSLIAALILLHIMLNLETEKLKKENMNLQEKLNAQMNKNIELKVERQKLESEELIIPAAEFRLGLSKFQEPYTKIEVDQNKIKQITGIVNSKYE